MLLFHTKYLYSTFIELSTVRQEDKSFFCKYSTKSGVDKLFIYTTFQLTYTCLPLPSAKGFSHMDVGVQTRLSKNSLVRRF